MSSESVSSPPAQVQGGSISPAAMGFGLLSLILGLGGYLAPMFGVPFGLNSAAATVLILSGIGLIVPCFVRFGSLQDYAGGMFLIVLAAVGIAGTTMLNFKTTTGVGPGMMPRSTGLIVAALGLIMVINGFFKKGEGLDRWSVRGIIFVLGSALVFGWTIRPMGLAVAGPLAVMISAFADRDTKWIEVITFSVLMTALCIVLFSYGLKLPIPIWPTQMPYIPGVDTIKF